jgi:phosphoglycerate dehydrogenase-like enzyme
VLAAADVIVLAFNDHISATVGLISAESFKVMKPGAQLVMFVGSLGVDEKAAYDAVSSGALGGIAINQWWERWAWRPPRDIPRYMDNDWAWAAPSSYPFEKLPNVLMAPNACEKSVEYWGDCAAQVAKHLDDAAHGSITCAVN